ncbi:carbohydrate ABC transporter permease, partial [Ideonella sp.]|uniref:carbohydrate ABC transporter permease n=1 Tax=Ideonella sp. TaxID=1929293 RepID=UPI003BB7145B
IWISFHDHDLLADDSHYIALENYRNLIDDDVFHQVLLNTLRFVAFTVPACVLLGLGLALALNRPGRLYTGLRALFFGASVLSVSVVSLVWMLAMMPDRGLISQLAAAVGIPDLALLTTQSTAMPALAFVTTWWVVGLPMMLFLSALQQIPADLYEAAALDNASRWATFSRITLPSLRRTVVLVVVIEVLRQIQVFPQVMLLTNGGPSNSTRPIVQFIYEQGFVALTLGYASAATQVLLVFMLAGVSLQLWLERSGQKGNA